MNPISHPDFAHHILVPIAYFDRLMRQAYGNAPPAQPASPPDTAVGRGRTAPADSPTLLSVVREKLPEEWKPVKPPEKPSNAS